VKDKENIDSFLNDERSSPNKFANGSNMSCGNFITDKPTSCVVASLGGKSQICFRLTILEARISKQFSTIFLKFF